jgi:osmotically-inducible protein OsmY
MVRRRHNAAVLLLAAASTIFAGCTSTPSQPPTGQTIEDGIVTAKVKQKLVEDPVTKPHQITVETFKGHVQLSGFVETDQARNRALQLARDTKGVKQVKDAMEVRKEAS